MNKIPSFILSGYLMRDEICYITCTKNPKAVVTVFCNPVEKPDADIRFRSRFFTIEISMKLDDVDDEKFNMLKKRLKDWILAQLLSTKPE